ncbi:MULTISPECIES: hypothetical protein [Psychrobacter]|jgi:hypothetical protein|uniref:hypothetical protein n=1 Tax=Psychrobacter TaxID=497 RepID=UPI00086A55D6|nr:MULTISPECIES: hypothetical protein [Psychrobacter]MBA6243362.1 hypothetical protein [Psychrobacter sp. Urea-trap-18]MBA6286965.1 hypothetical protein [Psychrobacter sp. Urea-trap-16]MBA6318014.1 hypothetical protein [Psychrobacter sp. Urea-trap-20]MBA6333512.1 hypothetical protein [Psychrobacter sp. Urea-trap-19]NYR09867.1 hypothetical protein [Psychrobacter sp. BI730]|tara:strand:- start:99480 stop:99920 length:441 start_codon:yes stop_codon:yes gene_type:complete
MTVKAKTQRTVKQRFFTVLATLGLVAATIQPTFAAIEIDETDFGPSYETMVVDTIVGKPLQLVNAVAGTAAYIVSLPFSLIGGNADQAQQKLFVEPWNAMGRCLGCTVAEDNYYKSQVVDNNVVRIVVDQPSEILINTNDYVVVTP